MTQVIFEIDDEDNHTVFCNAFEMKYPDGPSLVQCRGSWKGVINRSYLCTLVQYHEFVRQHTLTQISILTVTDCNKAYVTECYNDIDRINVPLGSLHQIPQEEALTLDGWTQNLETGLYYTAREGNPDGISPQAIIEEQTGEVLDLLWTFIKASRKLTKANRVLCGSQASRIQVINAYEKSRTALLKTTFFEKDI